MYRPARHEDISALKHLAVEVIRHNYTPFLGAAAVEAFISSGEAEAEIDNGLERCMVLEDHGAAIGFAITNEDVLHLLMIAPGVQRQGYGTGLLRHVETALFRRFPRITLQSFKANEAANAFYRRNGWKVVGEEMLEGIGIPVLHFEKQANN